MDNVQTQKVKVQVSHLTKKFGDLLVLNDMSFDVNRGDLLCVVGPTGCGKTTFLNCLTNIYDITSGQVLLDGKKVDCKKNNLAYIFQGNTTMPWLTVEQNVAFGLDIKHTPKKKRDEQVAKYLDVVGLTAYKDYYPKLALLLFMVTSKKDSNGGGLSNRQKNGCTRFIVCGSQ